MHNAISETIRPLSGGYRGLADVIVRCLLEGRDSVPEADRQAAISWLGTAMAERAVTASPHHRTGRLDLRALRQERGLTQSALASRVGVCRRSLGSWERSGRVPRLEAAYAIAAALGLDPADIVNLAGAYLHGGSRRTRERLATTPAQVDGPLIGARLRQAREAAGVRQGDMAAAIGVHRKTYQQYEAGRWRPQRFKRFQERVRAILDAASAPTVDLSEGC
jgi:DNA-binding XRE family transcriptional regulator